MGQVSAGRIRPSPRVDPGCTSGLGIYGGLLGMNSHFAPDYDTMKVRLTTERAGKEYSNVILGREFLLSLRRSFSAFCDIILILTCGISTVI